MQIFAKNAYFNTSIIVQISRPYTDVFVPLSLRKFAWSMWCIAESTILCWPRNRPLPNRTSNTECKGEFGPTLCVLCEFSFVFGPDVHLLHTEVFLHFYFSCFASCTEFFWKKCEPKIRSAGLHDHSLWQCKKGDINHSACISLNTRHIEICFV